MFPRSNRLPHQAFSNVYRHGKHESAEFFSIICKSNSYQVSRFAVQVGVKIDKLATCRNRMKRLIRESIRHLIPSIKSGYDCIIIARKNFSDKSEKEIEGSLKSILSNSQILNNLAVKQ